MPPFVKKTIEAMPAIYLALSIVGILNYYTRFNPFGVSVSNYLTTGELLMSFMPVLVPVALFILAFAGLTMLLTLIGTLTDGWNPNGKPRTKQSASEENELPPFWILLYRYAAVVKQIKNWKWQRWRNYTQLLGNILFMLLATLPWLLLAYVGVGIFYCVLTGENDWKFHVGLLAMGAFVAWSNIDQTIEHNKSRKPSNHSSLSFAIGGLFIVGLTVAYNRVRTTDLRKGINADEIVLYTESDTIRTNSELVYVGKLDAGYFLYERKDSTSIFIPSSEVKRVRLEKND